MIGMLSNQVQQNTRYACLTMREIRSKIKVVVMCLVHIALYGDIRAELLVVAKGIKKPVYTF